MAANQMRKWPAFNIFVRTQTYQIVIKQTVVKLLFLVFVFLICSGFRYERFVVKGEISLRVIFEFSKDNF